MRDEKRQQRLQILSRVDQIIDTKCKGCEHNKSTENMNYCNKKCSFGKELLKLGEMLGNSNQIKKPEHKIKWDKKPKIKEEEVKVPETKELMSEVKPVLVKSAEVEMTKEEFKRLYTEGYKKKEIAEMMAITPMKLSNQVNNKWGLNGWNPKKKTFVNRPVEAKKEAGPKEVHTKKIHAGIAPENKDNERAIKDLQNLLSDEQLKNKNQAEKLAEQDKTIGDLKDLNYSLNSGLKEWINKYKEALDQSDDKDDVINDLKESNEKLRGSLANRETTESDEERAYAYNTLKKEYQKKIDNQTTAYEELEMELDQSFKRFDVLEEKYDLVRNTLKMLL